MKWSTPIYIMLNKLSIRQKYKFLFKKIRLNSRTFILVFLMNRFHCPIDEQSDCVGYLEHHIRKKPAEVPSRWTIICSASDDFSDDLSDDESDDESDDDSDDFSDDFEKEVR